MEDASFPRLVSLACHDLRTPLATVHGFARTLTRTQELGDPASRYVEMIEAASAQLADLIEELALAARIEGGRWEPNLQEADTFDLARDAAERIGEERAAAVGDGGPVRVDAAAAGRALTSLAACALRHGGLEQVQLTVEGPEVSIGPITEAAAPIVLGQELRDLGAAVAVRVVRSLGGSAELDGERLRVRLPAA